MPTTYIIPHQQLIVASPDTPLPPVLASKLKDIDVYAAQLLTMSMGLGMTMIITNAADGWVEISAQRFLPLTWQVLTKGKIEIVSARSRFE